MARYRFRVFFQLDAAEAAAWRHLCCWLDLHGNFYMALFPCVARALWPAYQRGACGLAKWLEQFVLAGSGTRAEPLMRSLGHIFSFFFTGKMILEMAPRHSIFSTRLLRPFSSTMLI